MSKLPTDTATARAGFARRLATIAGIDENGPVIGAFAKVPREYFLGPPPWQMAHLDGSVEEVAAEDPAAVYQDTLFVLDAARGVNNGVPSLHARLLHEFDVQPGQTVVHLGAGTGYYSAILAELVGRTGKVIAVEFDPALARLADAALAEYRNVEVVVGDAAEWPLERVDRIYVNFAVAHPADTWIEQLAPEGRLLFPLGVPAPSSRLPGVRYSEAGAALLVACDIKGYSAHFICPVSFVVAEGALGATDEDEAGRLSKAFQSRRASEIRSLIWKQKADPERCWFCSPEWSLSFDPPGENL